MTKNIVIAVSEDDEVSIYIGERLVVHFTKEFIRDKQAEILGNRMLEIFEDLKKEKRSKKYYSEGKEK